MNFKLLNNLRLISTRASTDCLIDFNGNIIFKNSEVIHKNQKKFTIRPNYFYKPFLY